jgi:16S rRNA (uracil1498-N3)-methyltransferase
MEAAFPIHLIQAVPKAEKMEWLLQKGTELGIREFSPVLTGRTVPALQGERSRTRLMRWRRIVEEAARQCQRPWLPIVHEARTLAEVLSSCREALRLVCWEEESRPLAALLSGQTPVDAAVCIGPEGGFEKNEIRQLEDADFQAVSLGPRILRTETAGLAVAAIFQYLYGDMGSTIKNWILT